MSTPYVMLPDLTEDHHFYANPPWELYPVVKFRRMSDRARLPTRATPGSACLDLYAHAPVYMNEIQPYATAGTGIEIELPPGYVGLVCSRSGLAAKQRVFVLNSPGVIDADYRGEIKVLLGMLPRDAAWPSLDTLIFNEGDRIAQLMVLPLPAFNVEEVQHLTPTARADGGLGSTGT